MSQPKPPSIHVRAFLTWLAIYPLVTIAFYTVIPLLGAFPAPIKVLGLTAVVIPTAVYLVMPNLFKVYFAIQRRRAKAEATAE
jgi:antibiotic biosynthesis monooxygenase (ABM) superfamily enzyme